MELYVLSEDNVEEVSERTGRTVEQLLLELLAANEKGAVIHYYFDLPKL